MGPAGYKYAGDTKLFSSIRYLLAGLIQKAQLQLTYPQSAPPLRYMSYPPHFQAHCCYSHPLRALSISAALQGSYNLFWISRTLRDLADLEVPFAVRGAARPGQECCCCRCWRSFSALNEKLWSMYVYPAGYKEVAGAFPGTIPHAVDFRKATA